MKRLAVIGVGLIGGSFALGLKKAKAVAHVVGVGRNPANLKVATYCAQYLDHKQPGERESRGPHRA